MTHAYVVLERAGKTWVLPSRLRRNPGAPPGDHNRVSFVYVDDPEDAEGAMAGATDAELETRRVQEAVRWACNGIVDPGRRFLVLSVRSGEIVTTSRPPVPPVEYEFGSPDLDDLAKPEGHS